tara:strand:+ start:523 stop:819 length:297 start_codon:yes stop_codon:yes gene_type:complete
LKNKIMITEQHYTRLNEHPEDRIFRDKEYINRLQKHIDEVYEELSRDLRVNMEGKDYLFDYIFNEDDKDLEFEDYLNKLGHRYDEMTFRKRKPSYLYY